MAENVVSRIDIDVRGAASADKAAASLDKLVSSENAAVVSSDKLTKIRERSEVVTERLARKYDAEYRILQDAAKAQRDLDRAQAAGLAGTRAYEVALAGLEKQQRMLSVGFNDNAKALGSSAKAAGLARHEWINLSRQIQDVGVSLAGGASPFMVLTQQGGQIADVFSSSGSGAGAALKDFGATVTRFALHPVTLIAGAAATAGLAMYRWKEANDALVVSLNGLGRQSGMTLSQINRVAESSASRSGISINSAQGLAGQFLNAGVAGGSVGGAIGLTRGLSRGLGLSLDDAAKELAQALADPAKGADDLAKKYGLVSFSQREQIKQLAAVGDRSGATAKLLGVLGEQIARMKDPTSVWTRWLERAQAGISDFFTRGGRELTESSGLLNRRLGASGPRSFSDVFGDVKRAAEDAKQAQADVAAARNQELARLREDSAFAVREITARTFAEREAVATERARVTVMRETHDAVRASIAAESERAKLLAESARKVDDLARTSSDSLRLARMTPFERRMAEIDIAERDFRRENIPNAATPMATEFNTAGVAARNLADALNQSAGRIGRLIPLSEWQGSAGASSAADPRGMGGFIQSEAQRLGIDPAIALRVARAEGLRTFLGDQGTSGGAFQLHRGGMVRGGNSVAGLGDDFARRTGLDPLDPANERQTITFALETAKRMGWGPFHGAARAGIGRFEGIGGAPANDNLSARTGAAFNDQRAAAQFEAIQKPLQDANREIERQRALLQAQAGALGQSTEATARAAREQELLNQFQAQGVPITDQLRASISSTAENYGRLAAETEDFGNRQRHLVEGLDLVRSSARDAFSGVLSDLRSGKSAGEAFEGVLNRIVDRLASAAIDQGIEQLFGRSGQAGGGLFGSLFGGGSGGPMQLSGATPAGGGGGFFSSLFSGIGDLFGFANGGIMTSAGSLPLHRYASGGVASSPQLAMFGEGSRPEAYVPLPDGRSIPVDIKAARGSASNDRGGRAPNIVVNNNAPGVRVIPSVTQGEVQIMIASAISAYDDHSNSTLTDRIEDRRRRLA